MVKFRHIILLHIFYFIIKVRSEGGNSTSNFYRRHPHREIPQPRIIGGRDAEPHAYPYQAALFIENLFTTMFCGGTLITPTDVLTAAHCIDGAITARVILGAHNLYKLYENGRQMVLSEDFIIHEEWNPLDLLNDIAIVKLPRPADLNLFVKTIKIALNKSISYDRSLGILTGWGVTSDSSEESSPVLQVLKDDILSNGQCKIFGNLNDVLQSSHICTNGRGRIGSCNGDSGGPLVVDKVQVGIVSFGNKYCEMSLPSVFTRVSSFSDWIIQNSNLK